MKTANVDMQRTLEYITKFTPKLTNNQFGQYKIALAYKPQLPYIIQQKFQ